MGSLVGGLKVGLWMGEQELESGEKECGLEERFCLISISLVPIPR
jgi:hypothetical protein